MKPSSATFCAFLIACALALWLAAAAPVMCDTPARLTLEPSAPSVAAGQEFSLTVRVAEVTDLYGLDLRLTFDPVLLEVVDADPAKEGVQSLAGEYPYPELVARNEADNAAGTLWYMVTQLGARAPVSGEGTIVTARLRALAPGEATIGVQQADLASNEGFMIPVESAGCTVRVDAEPAPPAGAGEDVATPPSPAEPTAAYAALGVAVVGAGAGLWLARGRRR